MQVEILVPIAFFSMIFGIVYLVVTSRHREKMSLIDHAIDPSIFRSRGKNFSNTLITMGLFLLGIGVGIVVGEIFSASGMRDSVAFPSMIFIFGGIALVASHFATRKNKTNE